MPRYPFAPNYAGFITDMRQVCDKMAGRRLAADTAPSQNVSKRQAMVGLPFHVRVRLTVIDRTAGSVRAAKQPRNSPGMVQAPPAPG